MSENVTRSRLDVAVRRAGEHAERFRKEEMLIVGDAAANGRLGSSMLELLVLEQAKRFYREACIGVIRDMQGVPDGLAGALAELEPKFHRKPESSAGAYGRRFDPGFQQHLSKIRTDILEDLKHGLIDMGTKDGTTTHIHQTGANSVAVATGSQSTVHLSVSYDKIATLVPAAMAEARGYNIADDDRDSIIDHIQTIADETKKPDPDSSRLKRIGKKVAAELDTAASAAMAAGGAALGTGAVGALLSAIGAQ